jgi:DNA-directed RNA polymerase subunit RPC12/RpoP
MNELTVISNCPECGAHVEDLEERSTIGLRCPNCGWCVVTTNFLPIEQDVTVYEIFIHPGNRCDERQIKLISQLNGCNFLQAHRMLQEAEAAVYKGKASQVLAIKQKLIDVNLAVTIKPEFCW